MANEALVTAINKLKEQNARYQEGIALVEGVAFDQRVEQGETLKRILDEIVGSREDARGDNEEARRERGKGKSSGPEKKGPGAPKIDDEFNLKGILQIVAGIGAAVAGFAAGIVSSFSRAFKLGTSKFRAGIKNLFRPVARFIDALTDVFGKRGTNQFLKGNTYKTLGNLTKTFRGFADGVRRLETRFSRALSGIKSIATTVRSYAGMITNSVKDVAKLKIGQLTTSITNGVKSIFSGLTNIQKAITGGASSFRELRSFATLKKKIMQPLEAFGKAFKGVSQNVEKLGKAAKAFAKVGGTLGKIFGAFKVIGRFVAFPLTIIMGIVDGFKGLMAGMERQEGTFNKVVGGFMGAIGGVIKGLIMVPLDLLKDAISWVAGKLGFENFSAMLDGFSFAETFTGFVNRLTDGVIYTFTSLFDSVMKPFEDGVDFASILEFVITLPYKIVSGFLDLIKTGIGALLGALGATDMEAALGEFSFLETFDSIIQFVKNLPMMLADAVLGFFEDPMGSIGDALTIAGDFGAMALEAIKSAVRALLPDPDSLIANVIPSAVYDWAGEAPPPAPEEAQTPAEESSGRYEGMNDYEKKQARLKQREEQLAKKKEIKVVETTGTDDDGFEFVERKRVEVPAEPKPTLDPKVMTDERGDVYGDEFIDPVTGQKRRQRIFKSDQQAQAKVDKDTADFFAEMDRMDAAKRNTGQQLDTMSRQNAVQGGAGSVMVNAPQQSNVTNNNTSQTAAVIDQNLPTQDLNDRSWSFAG